MDMPSGIGAEGSGKVTRVSSNEIDQSESSLMNQHCSERGKGMATSKLKLMKRSIRTEFGCFIDLSLFAGRKHVDGADSKDVQRHKASAKEFE
jgi:hypothetical protein